MYEHTDIIIVSPKGELILKQRNTNPDVFFAGYVSVFGSGNNLSESPLKAAIRIMKQELKISAKAKDLKYWRTYKVNLEKHGALGKVYTFIYQQPLEPKSLKIKYGKGYKLIKSLGDAKKAKLTPLSAEYVRDFFLENKMPKI